MKYIELTKGKLALVSDEDFEELKQYKWCATNCRTYRGEKRYGDKWYAMRRATVSRNKVVTIYMHRWIMNATKGKVVDHLDGDGLNNQRENLRLTSSYENNKHAFWKKRKKENDQSIDA